MQLAGRLVNLRRRRKISQARLASLAGMSPGQLNRYERGRTTPTLVTIERLALALHVAVKDLVW